MSFYQIYLTYLAVEGEYILTLRMEVWTQIPKFLVFGSDPWWTSTNLFTNAINDIMIIFEFESGYQNILPNILVAWYYMQIGTGLPLLRYCMRCSKLMKM